MIIEVRPNWHEGFDNPASFQFLLDHVAQDSEMTFENRGGIYAGCKDVEVSFYAYKQPGEGFGGREFPLKMKDGTTKVLKGPWSGSAYSTNTVFPELLCIDASVTEEKETWSRGHTFFSGAVLLEPLIDWWLARHNSLDWGIMLMDEGTIQPSKGRFLKDGFGSMKSTARLLPSPYRMEDKYINSHKDYFISAVRKFYAQVKPTYDEVSAAQRQAINA